MRGLADIVPLRTAACRDAVDAVAMIAAGEVGVDRRDEAHVRSCLRCQAEVAAYRRVLATMRSMRDDRFPVPAGAVAGALGRLQSGDAVSGDGSVAPDGSLSPEWAAGSPWAVRAAYVGGITAASAAGVLVWVSRRRLGLAPAI
jgi:hypothetical protein